MVKKIELTDEQVRELHKLAKAMRDAVLCGAQGMSTRCARVGFIVRTADELLGQHRRVQRAGAAKRRRAGPSLSNRMCTQ